MKKKNILMRFTAVALVLALGAVLMGNYRPQDTKETAHEIAELARSLGLPEDDPIIVRARELWWEADAEFCRDRDIIATATANEAGDGSCSDRHMELVAVVPRNRLLSPDFPDSLVEIMCQPKQYLPAYADPDSYYGRKARANKEMWAKCQEIATRALLGEIDCPENVLYQSQYVLGKGIYETHKTSYSTTYFCYG